MKYYHDLQEDIIHEIRIADISGETWFDYWGEDFTWALPFSHDTLEECQKQRVLSIEGRIMFLKNAKNKPGFVLKIEEN